MAQKHKAGVGFYDDQTGHIWDDRSGLWVNPSGMVFDGKNHKHVSELSAVNKNVIQEAMVRARALPKKDLPPRAPKDNRRPLPSRTPPSTPTDAPSVGKDIGRSPPTLPSREPPPDRGWRPPPGSGLGPPNRGGQPYGGTPASEPIPYGANPPQSTGVPMDPYNYVALGPSSPSNPGGGFVVIVNGQVVGAFQDQGEAERAYNAAQAAAAASIQQGLQPAQPTSVAPASIQQANNPQPAPPAAGIGIGENPPAEYYEDPSMGSGIQSMEDGPEYKSALSTIAGILSEGQGGNSMPGNLSGATLPAESLSYGGNSGGALAKLAAHLGLS